MFHVNIRLLSAQYMEATIYFRCTKAKKGPRNLNHSFYVSSQRYEEAAKECVTVGHLPREISRHVYHFFILIQVAGKKYESQSYTGGLLQ